jgi:hypothetical protein
MAYIHDRSRAGLCSPATFAVATMNVSCTASAASAGWPNKLRQ